MSVEARCIVTKGGVACALVDLGLGARRRLLMPAAKDIAVFKTRRTARRRIARTRELTDMLGRSMLADWPKLEPLRANTPWAILPTTLA